MSGQTIAETKNFDLWTKDYEQSFDILLDKNENRIAEVLVTMENNDNEDLDEKSKLLLRAIELVLEKHGSEILENFEKLENEEIY